VPANPSLVLAALRDALSGVGPAILPVEIAAAGASDSAPAAASPAGTGTGPHPPHEVARRIALVVETSGSTATPKRVALSADALLASAAASDSLLGGSGQWLLALPVHYIAGLNVLVRSIASGTDPVILDGPFDPHAFAAAAERLDGVLRFTSLVPAQLSRLLETDDALPALRRFDRILVGGQSTPAPLLDRARELGITLTRTYGSSETSGGCVYDGVPIGNTEARVVGGEIELSGSVLADGYLDAQFLEDRHRTDAAFSTENGRRWYRTGDTGSLADGVLRVTGRLDDVIISGGLKVSLAAVERVVRSIDGQSDAVVVRAPSERWGEVPVVVTTRPIALDDLRHRLVASLGRAAAPDRVVVVAELPMLGSGKPDRREIQRIAQ
jgi:O-succinylbenzoic acid--CoA ligase